MVNQGWTHPESPFHAGELAVQTQLGVNTRIDRQGRRLIRNYLTQQHRQFFTQLSYVIVGSVDCEGHLWASILVGSPGFLSTPDEHTLRVSAQMLWGDPLTQALAEGIDIAFLGIELHTRRRNRLNGVVTRIHPDGFEVRVGQSFGNCPQYIQARGGDLNLDDIAKPKPIYALTALSASEQALITKSDTFFIATAYQNQSAGAASGVDVSHRGGNPGFIQISDDDVLTIPDFKGNDHFNTVGNLALNPRAGLLFIDFAGGDLLYLTGTTEIIWEGPEISHYAGAERLLRFHPTTGYRIEGSLPLRWSEPEFSPFLPFSLPQ